MMNSRLEAADAGQYSSRSRISALRISDSRGASRSMSRGSSSAMMSRSRVTDGPDLKEYRPYIQRSGPSKVAISLMWNHDRVDTRNDLDLWVTTPCGERIGFSHKYSVDGGELDVDRLQDAVKPIENTVWLGTAPTGTFKIQVHNFSANHSKAVPFYVSIAINGNEAEKEVMKFTMPGVEKTWVDIKSFVYGDSNTPQECAPFRQGFNG